MFSSARHVEPNWCATAVFRGVLVDGRAQRSAPTAQANPPFFSPSPFSLTQYYYTVLYCTCISSRRGRGRENFSLSVRHFNAPSNLFVHPSKLHSSFSFSSLAFNPSAFTASPKKALFDPSCEYTDVFLCSLVAWLSFRHRFSVPINMPITDWFLAYSDEWTQTLKFFLAPSPLPPTCSLISVRISSFFFCCCYWQHYPFPSARSFAACCCWHCTRLFAVHEST